MFHRNGFCKCQTKGCQNIKLYVLVTQSCPALCNSMDCSPPGSPVHGIFQVRILEWVAISFSRVLTQGLNPGVLHCRQILYCLSHWGSLCGIHTHTHTLTHTHTHNGIVLSHKKERNWVMWRDVGGPRVCQAEWSKSEREKQISLIRAYMWNLGKWGLTFNLGGYQLGFS